MIRHKNGLASWLSTSTIALVILQLLFFLRVHAAPKLTIGYATMTAALWITHAQAILAKSGIDAQRS